MQQVVSFVSHQELRAVGCAQNERAGRAQTRNGDRIVRGSLTLVQQAADLAPQAARGNGGLHGDGQSEQRPARMRSLPRVMLAGAHQHPLRVEVCEGIERRIEPDNLCNVGLGQLNNGDCAGAQEFQLPRRRLQNQIAQGFAAFVVSGSKISHGVACMRR